MNKSISIHDITRFSLVMINRYIKGETVITVEQEILKIIEKCGWKGSYVSMIKKAGHWAVVLQKVTLTDIKDTERVFRFLVPDVIDRCRGNNKLQFNTFRTGFAKYCSTKNCKECEIDRKNAVKQGVFEKYGVDNVGKLPSAISGRDKFWNDASAIARAAGKRAATNIEKYGCENVFQSEEIQEKIKTTTVLRFGVENASQADSIKDKKRQTCLKNFGVEHPIQNTDIKKKQEATCLIKYGVSNAIQNEEVKSAMMQTKVKNGGFTNSNSSREATDSFRN